ncbi:MAG: hypothetical protein AAFW60_01560 [Pseudomonadota bacterium]
MARRNEAKLRMGLEDEGVISKGLDQIGKDGQKMADSLERASKDANKGFEAVEKGAEQAGDAVEGLADRTGILAGPLKALGPGGLAAAAGIGALVVGLTTATAIGKEAVQTFAEIGDAADRMGVTVETFQALTAEASAQGVSVGSLESGMAALSERTSQITAEQGELYSQLKDTNPELLRQLQVLDSNEDRLRAVAKALNEAKSATDRARISYAAFGGVGLDVAGVLAAADGDIDQLIQRGKALGLVIEEDLVRNSQELAVDFQIAADVMDLQFKQAFIEFAPIALETAKILAAIAKETRGVAESFQSATERSSDFNQSLLDRKGRVLQERGVSEARLNEVRSGGPALTTGDFSGRLASFDLDSIESFNRAARIEFERSVQGALEEYRRGLAGTTAEGLAGELQNIEAQIQQAIENASDRDIVGGVVLSDDRLQLEAQRGIVKNLIEETREREAQTEALRDQLQAEERLKAEKDAAAKAERERQGLRRQAAALLAELGDATLSLALKEEQLAKIRDAGFIDQAQMDEALQRYKDRLTGVTEAVDRWAKVVEGARTPVETLQDSISELQEDLRSGALGEGAIAAARYEEAMRALSEALQLAKDAEREATEEFKAGAEIRDRLATAREAAMSEQELLEAEAERLNAIVASGSLTREEATEYLRLYSEELRKARGEVSLLERSERVLDGIMTGRIKTVEDLGQAIAALVADMIRQAAIAQAQAGNNASFGGFLQGIVGSVLGGFGGVNPSGVPPIVPTTVPQSHSGSVVGMGFPGRRHMSQPMASNERLVVTEVGQEILPASHRKQIIDYIQESSDMRNRPNEMMRGGLMPLDVNLNISRSGGSGEAEVDARQSGPNSIDIDVVFKDKVRDVAGNGDLNSALENQGFVRQTLR